MNIIKTISNLIKKGYHPVLYRSSWVLPKYRVKGCRSYFYRDLIDFKNSFALNKPLQVYYDELLNIVKDKIERDEKYSVIRLDDGEAYFLRKELHGNILRRHLTEKKYEIKTKEWVNAYQKNDLQAYNINRELRKLWYPIIGKEALKDYFPLHAVYCLVATRDIFKIAKEKRIGLIGSEKKVKIIKELMRNDEYKNYLGINSFSEYIGIPEKGAANSPDLLYNNIKSQINGESDIYLVGMGIVKLKILSELRDDTNSIIIDIGAGMDALAGIVPKDSRMFGGWTNYRMKDYNYMGIDRLSSKKTKHLLSRFDTKETLYL